MEARTKVILLAVFLLSFTVILLSVKESTAFSKEFFLAAEAKQPADIQSYGLHFQSSCPQTLSKGRIRQLARHYDREVAGVSNTNNLLDRNELEASNNDWKEQTPVLGSPLTVEESFDLSNVHFDGCQIDRVEPTSTPTQTSTPTSSPAEPSTGPSCSDTDGGRSVYIQGTVSGRDSTGNSYSYTDFCTSTARVNEYSCSGNSWISTSDASTMCPSGTTCMNGMCVLGSQPSPSPAGCTTGQTETCTMPNGCSGTGQCAGGIWGSCQQNDPSCNQPASSACVKLIDSGSPADKLDIVFVGGDGYSSTQQFASDVQRAVTTLFSVEPFSYKRDRINVYYVNRIEDFPCRLAPWCPSAPDSLALNCNEFAARVLASECPYEKIIGLVNRPDGGGIASDFNGDVAFATKNGQEWIAIHELGHLLGLYDEYVYQSVFGCGDSEAPQKATLPNCDDRFSGAEQQQCPKWANIQRVGCYQGCSYNKWYRPTYDNCIMMGSYDHRSFDPVDIAHLNFYLDRYRLGDVSQEIREEYGDISIARIRYKNGRFSVAEIINKKGYLPQTDSGNGEIVLLSSDDQEIYSSNVHIPFSMLSDSFGSNGKITDGVVKKNEIEFAVVMPSIPEAESGELYFEGKKVQRISLKVGRKSISMTKGWNLISSPSGPIPVADILLSCRIRGDNAYWWNGREYEIAYEIEPMKGYWIFAEEDCTVPPPTGEEDLSLDLQEGWNIISSNSSWTEIKGDCERTRNIWTWDATAQDYRKVHIWDQMDATRGYWVKVKKACTIVS